MKRRHLLLTTLIVLFTPLASDAEAQFRFGPQFVSFDMEEIGIGGRVDIGLGGIFGDNEVMKGLFTSFNGNYLFTEGDVSQMTFNLNAALTIPTQAPVRPYAGVGFDHYRVSYEGFSAGTTGLNLLGGAFVDVGRLPVFAEIQYSTTATGFLSIAAGVLFGGGGGDR